MGGKQWKRIEVGKRKLESGSRKSEVGKRKNAMKAKRSVFLPGRKWSCELQIANCRLPYVSSFATPPDHSSFNGSERRSRNITIFSINPIVSFIVLFSRIARARPTFHLLPLTPLLFFLLLSCSAAAQPPVDTFVHLRTYPEKAVYFEVDKLQQVYLVQENNTVIKYQADGKEQFRYNDNTRGPLQYLDPTDPFNVLLFYPGFQAITTLDRTMNERASQLLYNGPIINASAIGLARDNNIWVYDQASFTLHKVAADGQSILNSGNLSALLTKAPIVQQVVARGNWVYLFSPEQGVFVFDNFAQFHQLLSYEGYGYMQVQAPLILLLGNSKGIAYHTERLQDFPVPLPPQSEKAEAIRWRGNQCYLLMPDGKVSAYLKKEK